MSPCDYVACKEIQTRLFKRVKDIKSKAGLVNDVSRGHLFFIERVPMAAGAVS